jgi:hypothetical protein
VHYLVDKSNRIIDVDERWDATAARAQGGAGSMRSCIIGRALDEFMVGDATKMFVRAALDAARLSSETRVLPYRCDSADQHRRFEMVITPLGDGLVQVGHRLLEAQPRAPRGGTPSRARTLAGWRCSQCLFVRFSGGSEWFDTDLEPGALLAQDVCPRCAKRLFDASATAW